MEDWNMKQGMRNRGRWLCVLLCILMTACAKAPIDRDIEGHWRVETITRSGENTEYPKNMFYTMKLWLVEVADKSPESKHKALIGRLEVLEDGLRMYEFKGRTGLGDDKNDATAEELAYYGLEKENRFRIVEHSRRHLVLESAETRIGLLRF